MKDRLLEQKIKQKKFFDKNEEKPRELISNIKLVFFAFASYVFSLSIGIFIFLSVSEIIDLMPASQQHKKEVEESHVNGQLNKKKYEEATIKAKIKKFENLSNQANKSQKEVINFLNQQQNNSLEISLTVISENLLELNFRIDPLFLIYPLDEFDRSYSGNPIEYSYIIEFEHDKMKYITVRNAEPFEINYFQKQHQKFSILKPSNKNMKKTYKDEPIDHIRVELKNYINY